MATVLFLNGVSLMLGLYFMDVFLAAAPEGTDAGFELLEPAIGAMLGLPAGLSPGTGSTCHPLRDAVLARAADA